MLETELLTLVIVLAVIGLVAMLLTLRVGRIATWLTLAAILLLVFAALGVRVSGTGAGASVRVQDVSWSMGGAPVVRGNEDDRLVVFGKRAVAVSPGAFPAAATLAAAGDEGSDLATALRLAADYAGPGGWVTVTTDGRVEEAGLAAAASAIRAAGAAIRVVGGGRAVSNDVRVASLRVPGHVGESAGVTVLASVAGPPGSTVPVRLLVDGVDAQAREVPLGVAGRAGLRFDTAPLAAGRHEIVVAVRPRPGDPCAANDRRASGLVVAGARRAALLNAEGLGETLGSGGWNLVEGLPDDLADLDLVVIRDVSITAFEDRGDALRRYVEGGGLLVAGGSRCFGPGGWGGAPLEACLPVLSHPGEEGLFVAVLLDRSGTMAEPFGTSGPPKYDAARRATQALTEALPVGTELIVLPFANTVLGTTRKYEIEDPVRARVHVRALLDEAGRPRGGTRLGEPMRLVLDVLESAQAEKRLVLLFTDGRLEGEKPDDVKAAAAALRNEGVRVVCFAVGEDADRAFLDGLGGAGRRAVPVTEDGQVREEFLEALFELQGEDRILDRRAVTATGEPGLPALEIGAVDGLVRTWLRPGATAWHVTEDDAPVTAGRRYGLGRAVVATADLAKLPGAVTAALAEAAVRPASLGAARIEVRATSGGAHVVAAARAEAAVLSGWMTDAGGARHAVSLAATGPGRFEGPVPAPAPGACWFDLQGGDGSPVRAGASMPWPPEYSASGPDADALAELRRVLGGDTPADGWGSRDVSWLAALLALLLFLADRARSGLKRGDRPVR